MADVEAQDPPVESQKDQQQSDAPAEVNLTSEGVAKDKESLQEKNVDSSEGNGAKEVAEDKKTGDKEDTKADSRNDNKNTKRRDDRHGDRRTSNRGGRGYKNGRSGNRFDASSAKESDDPAEIRKQVEFYFSDSNLPNDKFLFEAIGGSENNAVPIKIIHSFKRMRRFQPFSAVVEALKESSTLNVVENNTAVQRKTPLPDGTDSTQPEVQKVFEDKIMSRSVYVKGFGREEPSTQFDIEAWFSKYGDTNQVRLRRATDSTFKGSVFVEFDSEETAKKFLALDPAPKYNGKDLMIKSKKQYCDEKVDDINSGAIRKEPDDRDWKARRDQDRKNGFPAVHKDGRDKRGDRRGGGGGRGRGGRDRGGRDNRGDRGGRRRDDSDDRDEKQHSGDEAEAKEPTTAEAAKTTEAVETSEGKIQSSTDTKKRDREDEKESEEAPAVKKTAVESEMTGGPEAIEKKTDE